MNGQSMLQMHPSVQDLTFETYKLNPTKAHYHSLVINSSPLHAPSDIVKKPKSKSATPNSDSSNRKGRGVGQVQVVRNEENLKQAALARLIPSEVGGGLPPVAPKQTKPLLSKAVTASKKDSEKADATISSSLNAQTLRELEKLTTDKENSDPTVTENKPSSRAGDAANLHRPSSLVTSRVSFEATDAASFSVYSCSCCHAKPQSSHLRSGPQHVHAECKKVSNLRRSVRSATPLSDYENMTSVSQRPSNHPSAAAASVTSSKLRTLEDELLRERESRLRTLNDLEVVRKRQQLLLSKLSPAEREQFQELVAGN